MFWRRFPCGTVHKDEVSCQCTYLGPCLRIEMIFLPQELNYCKACANSLLFQFMNPYRSPTIFVLLAVCWFVWMQVTLIQSCPVTEWPNVRKCNSPLLCCYAAASPKHSITHTHKAHKDSSVSSRAFMSPSPVSQCWGFTLAFMHQITGWSQQNLMDC